MIKIRAFSGVESVAGALAGRLSRVPYVVAGEGHVPVLRRRQVDHHAVQHGAQVQRAGGALPAASGVAAEVPWR